MTLSHYTSSLKEEKGFAGWDEQHELTPILEKMLSEADPDYKSKSDIKWNFHLNSL